MNNLEVVGGDYYGIYVGSQQNSGLNHIYLRNLDVHGAHQQALQAGASAEVRFDCTVSKNSYCNDILVDGLIVHDSTVANGIILNGSTDSGAPHRSTPTSRCRIPPCMMSELMAFISGKSRMA